MSEKDEYKGQKVSKRSRKQEEFWKKIELKQKEFRENVYPNKSREEKIFYWAGDFRQSVRSIAEYGFDPISVFSKEGYNAMKSLEPNIDEMLPEIFTKAHLDIDEERVYKIFGLDKNI